MGGEGGAGDRGAAHTYKVRVRGVLTCSSPFACCVQCITHKPPLKWQPCWCLWKSRNPPLPALHTQIHLHTCTPKPHTHLRANAATEGWLCRASSSSSHQQLTSADEYRGSLHSTGRHKQREGDRGREQKAGRKASQVWCTTDVYVCLKWQ